MGGEVGDTPPARALKQAGAFGSGANAHAAGVVRIGGDLDKAGAGQASDNAAHGGRFDLFGCRQFTQRFRAGKNQYRERREAGRALTRERVLPPQAAQQADGSGMQAVSDGEGIGARVGLRRGSAMVNCWFLLPAGTSGGHGA